MKLRRATIENFKKFGPPGIELDFRNKAVGEIADRFLILGDNGSGKTTILQAIALTLAIATRKIPNVKNFWWKGWLPERYFIHDNPRVTLEVELSDDENAATQEAAKRWWDAGPQTGEFTSPGTSNLITLQLEGERVQAQGGRAELLQLQGRSYVAYGLSRMNDPGLRALFPRLPGVFWYDQFRTVAISVRDETEPSEKDPVAFRSGVDRLDLLLRNWYENRSRPGQADYYGELEKLYTALFPGRRFAGTEPVYSGSAPTPDGSRFILSDGFRNYALAEMSAGEQAIFPILFEFVRQQIHHCVILTDEIDLNLHPPLAQMLLSTLPQLGTDNQFIFTTHASAISSLVSPYAIHRLTGGNLCL